MRDVTITAAPDFRTRSVPVGRSGVRYYYRSSANAAAILDAAADAVPRLPVAARPVPVPDLQGRPVGRRLRDGVAGLDLDPVRRRQREPALPRRARDRPPVVLRPRRQRPGPPAVRRRGGRRLRRPRDHRARGAGHAARPAGSTGRSTATRARATTRSSTSRAATSSTRRAGGWARRRSGRRCASTSPTTATGWSGTSTLLKALDDADAGRPRRSCSRRASRQLLTDATRAVRRRAPAASAGTPAAGAGSTARQPATSQAATSRSRRPQRRPYASRTRRAAAGRSAGHSVQPYARGSSGSRASTPGSGGWRIASASSPRGVADLDAAAGRQPVREVRLERVEVGRQQSPPGRRTPGRSAWSPRRTARLASRGSGPSQRVVGDDRRVDERGVDPQRELRVARVVARGRGCRGGARSGAGSRRGPRRSSRR